MYHFFRGKIFAYQRIFKCNIFFKERCIFPLRYFLFICAFDLLRFPRTGDLFRLLKEARRFIGHGRKANA